MNTENKKKDNGQTRSTKNSRLNVRISESEIADLNFVSFKDDESVSQIIRKAIKMYVSARRSTY